MRPQEGVADHRQRYHRDERPEQEWEECELKARSVLNALGHTDEVRRFMRREGMPSATQPLWVAVSGGSIAWSLLHVLRPWGMPARWPMWTMDCAVRPAKESAFVEDYCRSNGLPFRSQSSGCGCAC